MNLPQDILDEIEEKMARYRTVLTNAAIKRYAKQQEREAKGITKKYSKEDRLQWFNLVIKDRIPLTELAKKLNRTEAYVAHEIAWNTWDLAESDEQAARLREYVRAPGIGPVTAIKKVLREG